MSRLTRARSLASLWSSQRKVVHRVPELARSLDVLLQALNLRLAAREVQGATLDKVGVDFVLAEGLAEIADPTFEDAAQVSKLIDAVARHDRLIG